MTTNDKIITPIGGGIVQGRLDDGRVLVRLPVNDITRPRLAESLTPRATISGLWAFATGDLLEAGGSAKVQRRQP